MFNWTEDLTSKVEDLARLYRNQISNELSEADKVRLDNLLKDLPGVRHIFDEAENEEMFLQQLLTYYGKSEDITDDHVEAQFAKSLTQTEKAPMLANVLPLRKKKVWLRYAAAAAIILMAVTLTYYLSNPTNKVSQLANAPQEERFKNDVPAATNGAVLTLADGRQIVLDNKQSGSLALQGNMQVINQDGKITYKAEKTSNKEILYNTVSTSKGKYVSLTLADNSIVQLNAASTIYYPVEFLGNERRVKITGEAFFQVAKDVKKPFIVEVNGMSIQVTGTQFNVSSYEDENEIQTTLVEGAVKVTKGNNSITLNPAEQAIVKLVANNSEIKKTSDVNVDRIVAWKDGLFYFEKTPIEDIMKQVARWYDVEVSYDGKANKQYYFTIARDQPLSRLLKIMEKTGNVRFVIEGKKIRVIP